MKKGTIIALAFTALAAAAVAAYGIITYRNDMLAKEKKRQEQLKLEAEYNEFLASRNTFLANTSLNGIDVTGKTVEEAIGEVEELFCNGSIRVSLEDGSYEETIKRSDIPWDFTAFENEVNELFATQSLTFEEYTKGFSLSEDYVVDVAQSYDSSFVNELGIFDYLAENTTESEDAYVYVDPSTGNISVVEEVYGNSIDPQEIEDLINTAISTGLDSVVIGKELFDIPEITSEDEIIKSKKAKLEEAVNKEITIHLCGETTTLKGENLWKILNGDDDYVSDKALEKYIEGLKNKFDSYYYYRSFTTATGESITLAPGNYGWIIDSGKTASSIKKAVANDNPTPVADAGYSRYGQRPIHNEISNTYIEVSIACQKIWVFINGECVLHDDVTTGEVTTGNPETITNRGVFKLTYKTSDVTLRGSDYEEPVSYWMPFDGGIGFHDATWREDWEFGGENYMGNGSHGCVNMRLDSAAVLYNLIDEEIPIIIW